MQIKRSVRQGGVLYRTNASKAEMESLDANLTKEEAKRLTESGHLDGFKGGRDEDEDPAVRRQATVREGPVRPQGGMRREKSDAPQSQAQPGNVGDSENLPSGIPMRMQLVKAGFDTPQKIRDASDEDLTAIDGIGEASVSKIRDAVK